MDVDNSGSEVPGGGGGVDVEQSLLQQFSCMGTSDKDELVSELQKVLGSHLNFSTAAFFLDMNNWNLQAAICSYFDVENQTKLPSMVLLSDPDASENENIEPNIKFTKEWRILNNGNDHWPLGCYIQCAAGDAFSGQRQLLNSSIQIGQGVNIKVEFVSPATPGIYQSKWRLCTPAGSYFGDAMWVILTVVEEGTMALTNQLSHLSDLGGPLAHNVPANPFRPTDTHLPNGAPPDADSMC